MIRRAVSSIVALVVLIAGAVPAIAEPGDLDPSFGGDGLAVARFHTDGFGHAAALDPSGRLVVAGIGGARFAFARFLPNGDPDPSFGTGGTTKIARGTMFDVAILPDGRIVGVGSDANGWIVCRLTEGGTLDPTFGDGGFAEVAYSGEARGGEARGVALDAAGRILVVGWRGADAAVARYRPRGVLDPTFSGDGRRIVALVPPTSTYPNDLLNAVAPTADGGLVAVGLVDNRWLGVVRLEAGGALVPSFGDGGSILEPLGLLLLTYSVIVQDERILVSARTDETTMAVLAYTGEGDPDAAFGGGDGIATIEPDGLGPDPVVFGAELAIDPSGRAVVVGTLVDDPRIDIVVARLESDGTPDIAFGGGLVTVRLPFNEVATGVAVRPTGEIVIGGSRTAARANMMLAVQLQA